MLNRKSITFLGALFLMFMSSIIGQGMHQAETVKVTGTVIARSPDSFRFLIVGTSKGYFIQDLLLRVEQDSDVFKKGQYLRLLYNNTSSDAEEKLPKLMFKKRALWEFTVTRRERCDSSLRKLLHTEETNGETGSDLDMKLVAWAKKEDLPPNVAVQCFEFMPGNFKKR